MANLQQILSSASLCTVAALGLLFGCRNEASYSNTDPGALYDGGQDFSALDAYLDERLAEGLAGFAMQILDDEGRVVFRRAEGTCQSSRCPGGEPDFSVQLVTSIASSTKWVTSTVVLAALDEGVQAGRWASVAAALDSAVVPELGCSDMTGPVTVITLRQLLSFTSGVIADHECVNTKESLRDCACTILRDSAAAMTSDTSASTRLRNAHPPGTTYKYGGSHLTIAGAWLEQISGEGWEPLFARLMLEPLDVDMQYVRAANLAGSIQTSVADYSRFVDALRADAQGAETRRLLSFEAVAAQRAVQARWADPSLAWLISPQQGLDYGLNVWRSCLRTFTEADATGPVEALAELIDPACDEVFQYGHGGKGGYNPFIDDAGRYSAVFAMREDSPGGGADYSSEELGITARVRMLTHLAMSP